jgi:hypothetical protein
MAGTEQIDWRKSSFCDSSQCAEVEIRGQHVMIRRSDGQSAVLTFSPDEWAAFVAGVKAGEFDVDQPR